MIAVSSAGYASENTSIDFSELPAIHFPVGKQKVFAYPAFEDYSFMLFDLCDAVGFTIETGDCLIYPMNATLGGNAIATTVEGNKLIVYDRILSSQLGYDGAEMVIAHELGHHYCGHLGKLPDPKNELEADAFAGAAAKLRGHSLETALSAVKLLDLRPSLTHPGADARVAAIVAGWNDPKAGKECLLP